TPSRRPPAPPRGGAGALQGKEGPQSEGDRRRSLMHGTIMSHTPSRQRRHIMHGLSWIRSSALALVLGVALATPAGAAMPDAWITMKTKLALLTTAGVSGRAINVDTVFGRVTLHGTVRSAAEQAKAEADRKSTRLNSSH